MYTRKDNSLNIGDKVILVSKQHGICYDGDFPNPYWTEHLPIVGTIVEIGDGQCTLNYKVSWPSGSNSYSQEDLRLQQAVVPQKPIFLEF